MIEVYKHFNSYDRATLAPSFNPRERSSRQHGYQLIPPKADDGARGIQTNSFYHRVAQTWNNLPKKVVEAETIDAFKNALDEHWKDDPMKFDHLSLRRVTEEED